MITASEFISRFNNYIKGREDLFDTLYMIVKVNVDGKGQDHYLSGLKTIYKDWKDKGPIITFDTDIQSLVFEEETKELARAVIPKISILIPKGKEFPLSEFKGFIKVLGLENYEYDKQHAMVQHKDHRFKYLELDSIDPTEEANYLINTRTLIEFIS